MFRENTAARPISPRTRKAYEALLKRAFGSADGPFKVSEELAEWTPASTAMLRAAVKRRGVDDGVDMAKVLAKLPPKWSPKRVVQLPSESEGRRFQERVEKLPRGRRALILLPLALGLRAEEVLSLKRRSVERAVDGEPLLVYRKGGEEQLLPSEKVRKPLLELLDTPRILKASISSWREGGGSKRPWKLSREILSGSSARTAYVTYYNMVRSVGDAVGVKTHPHLLRHLFATRMMRDGAPVAVIQWMLNHKDIATTMKYLHAGGADAAKYLREYGG